MEYKFFSLKGKRPTNEDAHNIINGQYLDYYAIYDGHGGPFVSKFLAKILPNFFIPNAKQTVKKEKEKEKEKEIIITKNYVYKVFDAAQIFLKKNFLNKTLTCGATCLILLYHKNLNRHYITTINTGDSRCILCRNNIATVLTKDHKPNWPDEKKRIEELGGNIYKDGPDYRVNGLSVSRSFGDFDSSYISCKPDIIKYTLNKNDKFIILCCDGLIESVDSQEAVNFVLNLCYDSKGNRINKNLNVSKHLAEYAIKKGSNDNVSIIVIFTNF
jgi:serine/threonine protein phosphatase PrpC